MIYKFIAAGVVILLLIGAGFKIKHDIYQSGFKACETAYIKAQSKENEKIIQKKKVNKHEVQSLDRIGIVNQLCAAGWVRDKSKCPSN